MNHEKEIYLREQMTSLFMFSAKSILALSSSAIAFSVGLQGLLDKKTAYNWECLVPAGWSYLLISITLITIAVWKAIDLQYKFFNNLQNGDEEINANTQITEKHIWQDVVWSFGYFILGVGCILVFIFINFIMEI